ncbi:hypothetical protein RCOM_1592570 [Ricinus communis]|uniref:Uncharacterized protein n=1 Tax=Ricinus communis TaxID=3988 RepID=B9R7J6_RICCO|nr:hypothetical protein RCOM_1592570 [Ricinus communis]
MWSHRVEGPQQISHDAKESAIRRQTEGDFRFLGMRESGRFFSLDEGDRVATMSQEQLIHPEIVHKVAEENGSSLGNAILNHVEIVDSLKQQDGGFDLEDGKNVFYQVEVVTSSLGFLTNFEDVYKMWAFVARGMDPCNPIKEDVIVAMLEPKYETVDFA